MFMGSNRGFTLIEMLVVIAIIAILAGIVLTGVLGFQASARDTRRIGDLRNMQSLVELYYTRSGFYPPNKADIEDVGKVPTGPPGAVDYAYDRISEVEYCLIAELEEENSAAQNDVNCGANCDDANVFLCISSFFSPVRQLAAILTY